MGGYVYIMASKPYGTLYTGVTSDLARRVFEHKEGLADGFTKRYACKTLVWFEHHEAIDAAIQRETSIKRYPRQWKLNLITAMNPEWSDLYEMLNR
ncbi:MAG: GIY-YIG nuclease family protein [Hyphomicrobiales bacterium]